MTDGQQQTEGAAGSTPGETEKLGLFQRWREFLNEVIIVVIGVLLALAAEQAVEWLHWQHPVADARAALRLELQNDDAPQAFTRVAAGPCFERQLDGLRDALEAARPRAEILDLVQNYKIPVRTWDMTSWNALLASGVSAHIAPEEIFQLSGPYSRMPLLSQRAEEEVHDWAALRPIRKLGDKLSPAETDSMLAVVARLRFENRYFQRFSKGLLAELGDIGIAVPAGQQRQILADLRANFQNCVITPIIAPADSADDDQTAFLKTPFKK